MKLVNVLLFLSLSSFKLPSQSNHQPSKISAVTVFEKGASITRVMEVVSFEGIKYIVFDSLPSNLNTKSIQVEVGNHLEIVSVSHKQRYYSKVDPKAKLPLEIEMKELSDSLLYIHNLTQVLKEEKELIENHDKFGSEEGDQIAKIREAAALYASRLKEIYLEQLALKWKKRSIDEKMNTVRLKVDSLNNRGQLYTQVSIKAKNKTKMKSRVKLTYYINGASWYSFYDARISNQNSTLQHKAYIRQHTGEDWKDVRITLSNKSPIKKNRAPQLKPIFKYIGEEQSSLDNHYTIGQVFEKGSQTPLIGATIFLVNSKKKVTTDFDGKFQIYNPNQNPIICTYTGMQSLTTEVKNSKRMLCYMSAHHLLDEVVGSGYSDKKVDVRGSRKEGIVYFVDGIRAKANGGLSGITKDVNNLARESVASSTRKSLNQISIQLEDPYSIPSNGQSFDVMIYNHSLDYERAYYAAPAMENQAYCQVGISEWQDFDLLSGQVNIYVNGIYGGNTKLNIDDTHDTLWLDIGSDEGIAIKRTEVKGHTKTTFLKKKIVESKAFEIHIKNNKSEEVSILVEEALPISTHDDLEIKYLELSNGKMNAETGIVQWEYGLLPGESRVIRVHYEMKYGKGKKVM